jgi:hypothetical protein
MDGIKNETIGTQLGMKKDIQVLQDSEEQQLRWYGHIMQMEDCRIAGQVTEWNPQEEKGAGQASQHLKGWD